MRDIGLSGRFSDPPGRCVSLTFPEGKGGRCVRLTTLPPTCAVVMKSGSPNFLEPSGPHRASNGTALTFLLPPFFPVVLRALPISSSFFIFLIKFDKYIRVHYFCMYGGKSTKKDIPNNITFFPTPYHVSITDCISVCPLEKNY